MSTANTSLPGSTLSVAQRRTRNCFVHTDAPVGADAGRQSRQAAGEDDIAVDDVRIDGSCAIEQGRPLHAVSAGFGAGRWET